MEWVIDEEDTNTHRIAYKSTETGRSHLYLAVYRGPYAANPYVELATLNYKILLPHEKLLKKACELFHVAEKSLTLTLSNGGWRMYRVGGYTQFKEHAAIIAPIVERKRLRNVVEDLQNVSTDDLRYALMMREKVCTDGN